MAEHPDPLVAHLLTAGLIGPEDVPIVLALRQQARDTPGVEIDDHDVFGIAQAIGRAAERVAAAGADVAVRRVYELPAGERADALERWMETAVPIATQTFGLLCEHRARQIAFRRLEVPVLANHPAPPLCVAFVDLRGSTLFMLDHGPQEIEALSDTLYAAGQEVAAAHDVAAGKFLGDGVLLLSADTHRLLEATRGLVEELGVRTPLRAGAGLAYGPVIRRAGDWHGPPVNLAARLAELAAPEEILVDAGALADDDRRGAHWRTVVPRGLPDGRDVAVFAP